MELDEFAYEYENLFSAAVSQTRKQIKKTKDFLKELLIHQGFFDLFKFDII